MMNESIKAVRFAGVNRYLECVDGQITEQRGRDLPADHVASVDVDNEADVDPPGVRFDYG